MTPKSNVSASPVLAGAWWSEFPVWARAGAVPRRCSHRTAPAGVASEALCMWRMLMSGAQLTAHGVGAALLQRLLPACLVHAGMHWRDAPTDETRHWPGHSVAAPIRGCRAHTLQPMATAATLDPPSTSKAACGYSYTPTSWPYTVVHTKATKGPSSPAQPTSNGGPNHGGWQIR